MIGRRSCSSRTTISALLPRYLKERNPNLIVAQFWHIPWPNRETFRVFPWKEELLDGLLGNDLLGFHLRYHCQNFIETVDRTIEARIDHEQAEIVRNNKSTLVRPFPISIDFERQAALAVSTEVEQEIKKLERQLRQRGDLIGIGIERIDYTKGIPERLQALDRFFERFPEYRERLTYIQVGVPSRGHIPSYRAVDEEIDCLVERINWKWSTSRWRPRDLLQTPFLDGRDGGAAPHGRFLHRQLAARRDEPGRQGVCRQPVG